METTSSPTNKQLPPFLLPPTQKFQPPKTSPPVDMFSLTCDDLTTLSVLLAYQGAALLVTGGGVLLLERILVFLMMLYTSDPLVLLRALFSLNSYKTTLFNSRVLLWNPWVLHLVPTAIALLIPLANILIPSPHRLSLLTGRIKIAATVIFTPVFLLAHLALYVHFQRLLLSSHKQIEDSSDLVAVLFYVALIFYFHFNVHFLWLSYLTARNIPLFYNLYSLNQGHHQITSHLIAHLLLYYPIILAALLLQVGSVYGVVTFGVLLLVGMGTGALVSFHHSRSVAAGMLMDPFLHFSYLEVMLVSGIFLGWTEGILHGVAAGRVRLPQEIDTAATNYKVIHFSVTMAVQAMYSSKAVMFLLRISPEYYSDY